MASQSNAPSICSSIDLAMPQAMPGNAPSNAQTDRQTYRHLLTYGGNSRWRTRTGGATEVIKFSGVVAFPRSSLRDSANRIPEKTDA